MTAIPLGGIFEEGADAGQLPRRGCRAQPLHPSSREEGAQVGSSEIAKLRVTDRSAEMLAEKIEKAMRRRDIGANRVKRTAAIVLEMVGPVRRERAGAATV